LIFVLVEAVRESSLASLALAASKVRRSCSSALGLIETYNMMIKVKNMIAYNADTLNTPISEADSPVLLVLLFLKLLVLVEASACSLPASNGSKNRRQFGPSS
jgi:hypothetical protein